MKIARYFLLLAVVLAFNCGITACKKKQSFVQPSQTAFDNAPADMKDMWAQAVEADKTNDFYKSEVLLYELNRRGDLSPEQAEAARNQLVLVHNRLKDLASKGDPAAKAAFDQMRLSPPNRPQVPSSQ